MKRGLIVALTFFIIFSLNLTSIICKNANAAEWWIEIDYPYHGLEFSEGDTIGISWTYSADSGKWVKIELYYDGHFHSPITSNTSNDGYYTWKIPSGFASTSFFQIYIESFYNFSSSFSEIFYIHSKSITVFSPNDGDTWFGGSTYDISWYSENIGDYVKIEYVEDSIQYTIDPNTYNSGSYSWTVPTHLSSDSSYRIKITSIADSNIYGYSDYFSIGGRSISITEPNGGETWYADETYKIEWYSANVGDYVDIYYKKEPSIFYISIATRTENDGLYEWTISKGINLGPQYTIRISSYSNPEIHAISNYFSIDVRYINIYSPRRHDKLFPNETYSINWDSENAGDYVNIRLFKRQVYCGTIASNLENTGNYRWAIPSIFSPDFEYQIEIRSRDYSDLYEYSDNFKIGERKIHVWSPDDGGRWFTEETLYIEWESEDVGHSVDIELYKDGEPYITIASYTENSGRYLWDIPDDLPDAFYQIKITSSAYSEVYSYSEGNFTISENYFSRFIPLLLIFILVIVIIAVTRKVIIKRKMKKKLIQGGNVVKTQTIPQSSGQINQPGFTSDEYDKIWEGNKP